MPLGALFFGSVPFVNVNGKQVAIRSPLRSDWPAWSALRAQSRDFLTPWEPSWAADSLIAVACGWLQPSVTGMAVVLFQALAVAALADAEYRDLYRPATQG